MVAKGKTATAKRKPATTRSKAAAKSKTPAAKRKTAAVKSKPASTKRKAAPGKSKPAAKRKAAPAKRKAAPAKRKAAPAKSKAAPAKRKSAGAVRKPAAKSKPAARRTGAKAPATGLQSEKQDSVQNLIEPYKPRRGEKYMGETMKAHFREKLLAWKSQLMTEVDRTVNHMQDEAAKFPDPTDRASQEEEFNLELKTRDRERKLIRKIDSTLDLIDQNDYGYCVTCGVEIGVHRLEARPTATQCIDCKTLDEIKERQILGG